MLKIKQSSEKIQTNVIPEICVVLAKKTIRISCKNYGRDR